MEKINHPIDVLPLVDVMKKVFFELDEEFQITLAYLYKLYQISLNQDNFCIMNTIDCSIVLSDEADTIHLNTLIESGYLMRLEHLWCAKEGKYFVAFKRQTINRINAFLNEREQAN